MWTVLAASSYSHYISEAFYVQCLSCSTRFTLQNGVCNCDPIFPIYTVECYIDDSAIKRFANTWITPHTHTNSTKYLISDCPMDYCLPYSSKLNCDLAWENSAYVHTKFDNIIAKSLSVKIIVIKHTIE